MDVQQGALRYRALPSAATESGQVAAERLPPLWEHAPQFVSPL